MSQRLRIVSWNINGLAALKFPFNLHSHHTHAYPPSPAASPSTHKLPSPSSPPSSSPPFPPDHFDYDDSASPSIPSQHPHGLPAASKGTSPITAVCANGSEPTMSPTSPDFPAFPSCKIVLTPQVVSGYECLLDYFQADIICMQEVKISRLKLDLLAKAAFVAGYDSFFSFSRKRQGYSGVVTYTRIRTSCPLAAEEGVTGTLPPIVSTLPTTTSPSPLPSALYTPLGFNTALLSSYSSNDLRDLDSEGRCVITDHGAFLLFNVYVPNAGDDRNDFKLRFLSLLELRIRECETAGRRVVVVGDLNISASSMDHCRPDVLTLDDGTKVPFDESPSRVWWRKNVSADPSQPPPSTLIDTLRAFYPTQRQAYTCWNTLTSARGGNYGARIDYVLVSQGLMPSVCDARVLGYVEGSDHCPVQSDFVLERLEGWKCGEVAPAHASQWWVEFSGQQQKMSQFFVKRTDAPASPASSVEAPDNGEVEGKRDKVERKRAVDSSFRGNARVLAKKKKVGEKRQSGPSLLSYFSSPLKTATPDSIFAPLTEGSPPPLPLATQAPPTQADVEEGATVSPMSPPPPLLSSASATSAASTPQSSLLSLSPSQGPARNHSAPSASSSDFNRLFTQSALTLLCDHQLPAKLWTVNKKGANHGRQFFCCNVPPPDRCKFWKWLSDAEKERSRGGGAAAQRRRREREATEFEENATGDLDGRVMALGAGDGTGFVSARQLHMRDSNANVSVS